MHLDICYVYIHHLNVIMYIKNRVIYNLELRNGESSTTLDAVKVKLS
jgi:hypothetical protein